MAISSWGSSSRSHHGQQRCVCEKCSSIPYCCATTELSWSTHSWLVPLWSKIYLTVLYKIFPCCGKITKKLPCSTITTHFYGLSFLVLNFPPGFITPERESQLACAAWHTRRGQRSNSWFCSWYSQTKLLCTGEQQKSEGGVDGGKIQGVHPMCWK